MEMAVGQVVAGVVVEGKNPQSGRYNLVSY